jgi:hypothetical protein
VFQSRAPMGEEKDAGREGTDKGMHGGGSEGRREEERVRSEEE